MSQENIELLVPKEEDQDRLSELMIFRLEIAQLKKQEAEIGQVAHFVHLDPEQLTLEDMDIWKKVETGALDLDEFNRYRYGQIEAGVVKDRKIFAEYLANRMTVIPTKPAFKKSA